MRLLPLLSRCSLLALVVLTPRAAFASNPRRRLHRGDARSRLQPRRDEPVLRRLPAGLLPERSPDGVLAGRHEHPGGRRRHQRCRRLPVLSHRRRRHRPVRMPVARASVKRRMLRRVRSASRRTAVVKCNGACDGEGACTYLLHDDEIYGRDFGACGYVACRPLANSSKAGASGFPVPAGTPCDNEEQCEIDDKATIAGVCVGTAVPDCTPNYGDSGADDSDDDAGTDHWTRRPASWKPGRSTTRGSQRRQGRAAMTSEARETSEPSRWVRCSCFSG